MNPGDWTPTGWGTQHRIRTSDNTWTELVCHADRQRCDTARINTDADEPNQCHRCAATPGLGPMPAPTLGEVRVDPQTGCTVVCVETWDGRVPTSPLDTCWLIVRYGSVSRVAAVRVDSYAVATWPVAGSLPTIEEHGRAA